jgi:hypothetical protein
MSKALDRKSITEHQDLKIEKVDVPEWDGYVYVRTLSGVERDAFEAMVVERRGNNYQVNMRNMRAKLACLVIVDESGERIFSDADAEILGKKSASALQRIFNVASRLSGISNEDVEELAKNLKRAQSEGSGSG